MTHRLLAGFSVLVTLGFVVGSAAAQAPQSVRVVSRARIMTRPSADGDVVLTADPGTVLDVLDADQSWYWVSLPPDRNGARHRGWIQARDAQPVNAEDVNAVIRGLNQKVEQLQQQVQALQSSQPAARPASNPIPPTAEDLRAVKTRREMERRRQEMADARTEKARREADARIDKARREMEQRRQEYETAMQSRDVSETGKATQMSSSRAPRQSGRSQYEIFAGYSPLWDRTDSLTFPMGWIGSISGSLNDSVAIVGEVSGAYKSLSVLGANLASSSIHTFTAGPQFSRRAGSVTTFGHVLGGLAIGSGSVLGSSLPSSTGVALIPGFGVDVPVVHSLGVRVGGEFGFVHNSLGWSNGFRLTTGLVIRGFWR